MFILSLSWSIVHVWLKYCWKAITIYDTDILFAAPGYCLSVFAATLLFFYMLETTLTAWVDTIYFHQQKYLATYATDQKVTDAPGPTHPRSQLRI